MELLMLALSFSMYIFIKNHNHRTIKFLSTTISIFLIYAIAHNAVNSEGYNILKTILFNHFTPIYLIAGPSFYFFIKTSIDNNFNFKKRDLIHLIPFIIQFIGICEYMVIPWVEKIDLVTNFYLNPEAQSGIETNIFFASETNYAIRFFHLMAYFSFSFFTLIKKENSGMIKTLKRVTLILVSILILYYIHILLIITKGVYNTLLIKSIITLDVILLFVLILEFLGSPELYLNSKKIRTKYLKESPYIKKTDVISIDETDKKELKKRIKELKRDSSFFLNSKNNFRNFATIISYPDHIIREYLKSKNTSFIDIKNKVRLSVAKNILNETKLTYNLDYIAEKSGFNSRSNFFTIFKKYEKCTPREYLNKKK
tara:strand:+ start:3495 stop:4604 length:1110 start_codon:yes stop_codon:yes gene_type:complete